MFNAPTRWPKAGNSLLWISKSLLSNTINKDIKIGKTIFWHQTTPKYHTRPICSYYSSLFLKEFGQYQYNNSFKLTQLSFKLSLKTNDAAFGRREGVKEESRIYAPPTRRRRRRLSRRPINWANCGLWRCCCDLQCLVARLIPLLFCHQIENRLSLSLPSKSFCFLVALNDACKWTPAAPFNSSHFVYLFVCLFVELVYYCLIANWI